METSTGETTTNHLTLERPTFFVPRGDAAPARQSMPHQRRKTEAMIPDVSRGISNCDEHGGC